MYDLIRRCIEGDVRAVARLITLLESGDREAYAALYRLKDHAGRAQVIGITGPPGAGKSTLADKLIAQFRSRGLKVGVLAVDPSSPFSGGAILGDRLRMQGHATDPGVFIRSLAARGSLGGISKATHAAIRVLDAAGYDIVLVETVGVGQAEVDIARMAHTVLVVEAPGLGDDIQALKAGLMEVADIFVVNKSDLPGSDTVVSTLRAAIALAAGQVRYAGHHQPQFSETTAPSVPAAGVGWAIPVKEAVALHDEGIDDLLVAVRCHRDYLLATGLWFRRDRMRIETDLASLVQRTLLQRLRAALPDGRWEEMVKRTVEREIDPLTAARELVDSVL